MEVKIIIKKTLLIIAILVFATSCSTSNDVASNRGIQKRKYNKGFFVSKNAKDFDTKKKVEINSIITNLKKENIEIKNETSLTTHLPKNSLSNTKQNLNIETNTSKHFIRNNSTHFKVINIADVNIANKNILEFKPIFRHTKNNTQMSIYLTNNIDNDIMSVILGVILCLIGLTPLGVWMIFGKGGKFILNLILFVGGILAIIASLILVFFMPVLSVTLLVLGILMLAAAYIHAFVLLIKILE